jgi:bacteriorhodopsin
MSESKEERWFAFGAAAFAAGFVALMALRRRGPADGATSNQTRSGASALETREEENDRVIHSLVVAVAGSAYLLMGTGGGRKAAPDHTTYWARYADWAITTPLLLLGLAAQALGKPTRRTALVSGLLATDLYMIGAGYLADKPARNDPMKWVWYTASSGAFLAIYYMLWGPLREEARRTGPEALSVYQRNTAFLSTVWAGYPLNFLAGPEGLGAIDEETSTAIYAGLDVTAKVLFGLYSLGNTQEKAARALAEGRVPEHELRPTPRAFHEAMEPGSPEEGEAGTTG